MDIGGGGVGFSSPATEEETVARKRSRRDSRRVSFADTTAVHVFDRDEDFETPPEERAASPSPSPSPFPGRPPAGDAAEGEETEEEGSVQPPFRFFRDIDSSSPSSAAGSAASSEYDNFFGSVLEPPVSTSFLLSGRPSDSGMSGDDNHDVTLDSHTFSMHYRNFVPPDDTLNSVGSLRVPSELTGPLKELTGSESVKSISGREALTDMSMIAENHGLYEYNKLSPTLYALLQEVKEPKSPKDGTAFVTSDHALTPPASEKEDREERCVGNGISSNEPGAVSSHVEHISVNNPLCSSPELSQQDNAMMVDIRDESQISLQENCKDDRLVVHPDINRTSKTPALLSPPPPCGYIMTSVDLQPHLPEQPLSKDQPPGANQVGSASILSSAAPTFSVKDAEQLHQQKQMMDSETLLLTPRTVALPLQTGEGSISSLRSKRQQLFSPSVFSTSSVVRQEECSLGSEFVKHGKRISALDRVLKLRLQESPATRNLRSPLVERNELVFLQNVTFNNAEDNSKATSVSCDSIPRQELKKTSLSSVLRTPRQELNEATKVHDTQCDALALDILPIDECSGLVDLDGGGRKRSTAENGHAEQQRPDKRAKGPRRPITSQEQLPCVSLSSRMVEENQSEVHGSGHSVNDDLNKVVLTISNAMKQIWPASSSKLNPQQLDILESMLGEIQLSRKYKRLSTTVRIQDTRLTKARFLHDKLLYEKAKLQINRVKLDKLRNKAQQCQVGLEECYYLKSKISHLRCPGGAQVKDSPLHAATLINARETREEQARITEKRLALSMIQKKVENVKSSLEYSCNTKSDISYDELIRVAEEQLEMRNQCQIIHQQALLWELNDIVKRETKRDVVLNYCNLLFQRIIFNISDGSSIFVNNSLIGTKIEQAFPNLNASVAFSFVFKAEGNQRVTDLRSLQKKTTETSFLLGNLIDVLEEIGDAKMELLNLISAAFGVESQTGQLAFRLCFVSMKRGKRIALTINMTDLNRAVYPAEPSELLITVNEAQTTLAQPSQNRLMASIRDLQPGRLVIQRLCRMVSQLVNTLPG